MMKTPMTRGISQPIIIFYSYADEDKEWQEALEKCLNKPRSDVIIQGLHRGGILGGAVVEKQIEEYLKQAQIILPLISPDFIAKHYTSPEVQRILELKFSKIGTPAFEVNTTPHVLPILVRPSDWKGTLFDHLQILPKNKIAISVSTNHDEVFLQIGYEIDNIIESFKPSSDGTQPDPVEKTERIYQSKIPPENPFFTGRADLLKQIRDKLTRQKTTAITHRQAIYGLGGIGKTELAARYVERFRNDYKQVLWVNADTRETLIKEYVEIAQDLELVERDEKNQTKTVETLKRWLATSEGWLLVLDNADDLAMVQEFIPGTIRGHLLLTTRSQAVGPIAESIEIERMNPEDGALFLLRRAKKIPTEGSVQHANPIDWEYAKEIVQELGGLPLALDQAGAYIDNKGEELGHYLQLYQGRGVELLKERGKLSRSHPDSVITTFSLAFDDVGLVSPAAANLLRLCAFLAPDDIPLSLLTDYLPNLIVGIAPSAPLPQERRANGFWQRFLGQSHNKQQDKPREPSPLETRSLLNDACEVLRKVSLIRRDVRRDDHTSTLTVHRLVQAVLRDNMDESTQRLWAERAVRIVNAAFPSVELHKVEVETWPVCEKLLPHVLVCVPLIEKHKFTLPEASRLLNDAATYLTERAQYQEAQPLYQQALRIRKAQGGPLYAQSLHNQAKVHERQASYTRAEQNLIEACKIREQTLGENHPSVAISLNSLAGLYMLQEKYDTAEPLYKRALEINQLHLEPEDSSISQNFNNLATLYSKQKKYDKAEELYKTALEILEEKMGRVHSHTAQILFDWGEFNKYQRKLDEAEALHRRALDVRKSVWGLKHPDTATSLNSIAELHEIQGNTAEAEELYKQSLSIREEVLGPEHPDTAASMFSLAKLYRGKGNVKEAEHLYKRALSIREKKLGLNHSSTLENQRELADLYKSQQRLIEAERLYKKGLASRYRKLRPDDPAIIQNMQALVDLYELLNKSKEIERLYEDAFEHRSSILGINHPSTEQCLLNLLKLYESQDKSEKTARLYKRTFEMRARKLRGDDHNSLQKFAQNVQSLSDLYDQKNKTKEKVYIYMEAYGICSKTLGVNDPLTKLFYYEWMKISEIPDNSGTVEEEIKARILDQAQHAPDTVEFYQRCLADFYEKQGKSEQAENMYEQALITSYRKWGLDDPRTIQLRHDLAKLYESHNKAGEAERIYRQALEICKRELEPGSPHVIESSNDLASCYLRHGKDGRAKPLIKEMLQICMPMLEEQPVPKDYILAIVRSLANMGYLYQKKHIDKKMRETAELWFKQALKISEEELGELHPDTVDIRIRYVTLLRDMGRPEEAAAVEINAITMNEANNKENEQYN